MTDKTKLQQLFEAALRHSSEIRPGPPKQAFPGAEFVPKPEPSTTRYFTPKVAAEPHTPVAPADPAIPSAPSAERNAAHTPATPARAKHTHTISALVASAMAAANDAGENNPIPDAEMKELTTGGSNKSGQHKRTMGEISGKMNAERGKHPSSSKAPLEKGDTFEW